MFCPNDPDHGLMTVQDTHPVHGYVTLRTCDTCEAEVRT